MANRKQRVSVKHRDYRVATARQRVQGGPGRPRDGVLAHFRGRAVWAFPTIALALFPFPYLANSPIIRGVPRHVSRDVNDRKGEQPRTEYASESGTIPIACGREGISGWGELRLRMTAS